MNKEMIKVPAKAMPILINFPTQVIGYKSPYPTVHIVITVKYAAFRNENSWISFAF